MQKNLSLCNGIESKLNRLVEYICYDAPFVQLLNNNLRQSFKIKLSNNNCTMTVRISFRQHISNRNNIGYRLFIIMQKRVNILKLGISMIIIIQNHLTRLTSTQDIKHTDSTKQKTPKKIIQVPPWKKKHVAYCKQA